MTAARDREPAVLERIAVPRLLDCLVEPVLIVDADAGSAWLNAPARDLEEWLRLGGRSRTLESALQATMESARDPETVEVVLAGPPGEVRRYRVARLPVAAAPPGDGITALVLLPSDARGAETSSEANSEIARARLEDVQRQLLQADRLSTIGQLAAGVAHEINNPIGYVQSNLVTLTDYVNSMFALIAAQDSALRKLRVEQPQALTQVEQVRQQIDYEFLAGDLPTLLSESQEGISRVRKIIQDLREFSRAGHLEEWTLADLHAGIDSTINIVWNELKYKVQLVKHYGEIPQIECLASQLNQVFMNILVNAGHAIETKGQITIVTRTEEDFVFVEISDDGKGIAEEHLARVFEPFFTTKAVGKGTGLGLSISYGIVRKHGGDIDVRSEVGVGTTFVIKLPVRQKNAGDPARGVTT